MEAGGWSFNPTYIIFRGLISNGFVTQLQQSLRSFFLVRARKSHLKAVSVSLDGAQKVVHGSKDTLKTVNW